MIRDADKYAHKFVPDWPDNPSRCRTCDEREERHHPAPETTDPHLLDVMRDVACEVVHARETYATFNSAHEGYAVLLEEVRELEREVFKSPKRREYGKMYAEAKQVAAMAVRFMLDIDTKGCVR